MNKTVNLPTTLKARLIILFLQKSVMSSVMPFMALYFTENFTKSLSGLLLITSLILNFLALIVGGRLADICNKKN